jgi:hypothetical protein
VKAAITPAQVPELLKQPEARVRVSAGGNVGYVSLPSGAAVPALAWPTVTLRGEAPLWPGPKPRFEIMRATKAALDPQNRFPQIDE